MSIPHTLFAILIVAIWGVNFVFIEFALQDFSPFFLCALRFFLASVPAIFFIKCPIASFKLVAAYGLIMFGLQFTLVFLGMHTGMTPGLTSLLMQVQIFFSVFFAALFLGEKPLVWQLIGAFVSFLGIGLIAMHLDHTITFAGFLFIISAAAAWGLGNLVTKKINQVSMMALVVWGSFVACIPMIFLSLLVEGTSSILTSIHQVTWLGVAAVSYITYVSTWIGYGMWGWLLSRYPVGTVVPFTILVPIFGMLSSVIILGEPLQSWKIIAALFVILGLCINLLGARFSIKPIRS